MRSLATTGAITLSLALAVTGVASSPSGVSATPAGLSDAANKDFATENDVAALENLTPEEQEQLIAALDGLSQEDFESGDPALVQEKLSAELVPEDEITTRALPAVILAAKVVSCLAPAYVALREINSGSPDTVAASIAAAVAGCVTGGGAAAIKSAILKNKDVIAKGLKVAGLGGLAALLTGDSAQASAAVSDDPAALPVGREA